MTTVICSEPVTIDLELSGATLQVQTDSPVYTVEWRRWWQVWSTVNLSQLIGRCDDSGW